MTPPSPGERPPLAHLYIGNAVTVLTTLPEKSVQCCVTSPPYWGLRDYGVDGQLGLERTPDEYVANTVNVFREVRRVLSDDGTLWLNLGDSYAAGGGSDTQRLDKLGLRLGTGGGKKHSSRPCGRAPLANLKPKDLVGIPWRVAFALQADGWYLRSDIIWSKPNPMPESVRDRPTKAHEYVFLLSKSQRYYYDADAIAEPFTYGSWSAEGDIAGRTKKGRHEPTPKGLQMTDRADSAGLRGECYPTNGRNARTVWEIATKPYPEAHFATFPPELAERCIKAGSKPGDTILDPFGGSGTTAAVATGLGRSAIHIDLNPNYLQLALNRIGPILCDVKEWKAA